MPNGIIHGDLFIDNIFFKKNKISGIEKKSLNILCRAAAMRYFLTRLYDYTNTPKTALIKIKDPREYYQKLIIHNNLKNYRDYLV